jgi:hypothetical protein
LIVIVRCSRFFVVPHRVAAKPGPLLRTMLKFVVPHRVAAKPGPLLHTML